MRGVQLRIFTVLILLFANIALGWLYVSQSIQSSREARHRTRNVTIVLEQNNVTLADDFIWPDTVAYQLFYQRGEENESAIAQALLGECRRYDEDGGMVRYAGESGSFVFRQDGSWEARWQEESAVTVESLVNRFGLRNVYRQSEHSVSQAFNGIHVINSGFVLSQGEDGTTVLTGTWIFGEPLAVYGTRARSAEACLMVFLGSTDESLHIHSAEAVYIMEPLTWTLTPLWHFKTDTGDFWIDAVSGEPRLVPRGE
jgi:hypothetical protein